MRLIDVVMPQFGMGMREGTLIRWLASEGDEVTKGQTIAEFEVEKADVELVAPVSGRIAELRLSEGMTASIQQVIARISIHG